ncbi:MAG: flagellar motor switch protein FliM [Alphaproteobacteria bacterium]|nr:flagellar motor switch protein FliM [Alphaproteobacteria bacterium]
MADENPTAADANDAALGDWEKMLAAEQAGGTDTPAAEGAGGGEEPARVLNQDEIDLLLGFDGGASGPDRSSGIYAILDKSMMAYEKLPMLEVVFDRLVRSLSASLRNFTSDNVDVSIDSMASLRFDDYLNSIPLPAMLVVYRAVEWENFGILTIDSAQIYSTVDLLLGGRRTQKPIRVEGRPYTTIEQDIVKKMVEIILNDMSLAFDPISPITFQYDRLESNPRFAAIARPNSAALLVRLRVEMEERGGMIEIVLPHATLEPIRDLLLQMFMGEKFGQDSVWERHLGKEVGQTHIDVEAILDERKISLGEIVNLKIGSTILLNTSPNDPVKVKCGGVPLTTAQVGRVGDKMAIAINDDIKKFRKQLEEQGYE